MCGEAQRLSITQLNHLAKIIYISTLEVDVSSRYGTLLQALFICFAEIQPEPPRDFTADIIFLIDSSFGVSADNFNKEKEFIKYLSAALNLGPKGSRVGIVTYASYSRLIRLGILQTPESLGSSLDGLTRISGLRRMDRALEKASVAFDKNRPEVKKIVVLLTAGRQSRGGKPLAQAVRPLKTIGAETFVVAIGSQINEPELTPIVKRKQDIILVPRFDQLTSQVNSVADYIINGMFLHCYIMFDLLHQTPITTKTFYVHFKQLCPVVITYLSTKLYEENIMSFLSSHFPR